jgi:nicotinate-nucleotide adenylyltransferase
VDTLYELRARHPGEPLWFIVGSDALRELDRWHQPQALFELANLAVVEREPSAGGLLALLPESLRAPFQKGPAGLIHSSGHELRPVPFTRLEISASDVRRRIARGASVRYLIPDPVLEYIEKQRLYA